MSDVELAVREKGRGPVFLWAHGLMSSMAQEDEMGVFDWSDTAQTNHLVRYDARCHGKSEITHDPETMRWPALAADMLGLADGLGAARLVLGGASMGCATSLYAALAAPESVERLVLVIPPTAWSSRPAQRRLYRAAATMVATAGVGAFAAFLRTQPVPPRLAAGRDVSLRHMARADRRALVAALQGASRSDLPTKKELVTLRIPVLILAWDDDPSHPLSTARTLAETLPSATLHEARSARDVERWPDLVQGFLTQGSSD